MEHGDAELLRDGTDDAFATLVRRHHRALVALAASVVGGDEAEEVVQSSWVKAHAAAGKFEGRSSVRTWLSRIVVNEARMMRRSRRREVFLEDQPGVQGREGLEGRFLEDGHWASSPLAWDYDSPEALLMTEDLRQCLERLLAEMPPRQRAVLEMRDTAGFDFDTICNAAGLSASNARVLLHRARTRLYALVDHYQETGEC